jgi:hypothetical protein
MERIRIGDQVELPDGTRAIVVEVLHTDEKGKFYKVRKIDDGVELVLDEEKVKLRQVQSLLKRFIDKFRS